MKEIEKRYNSIMGSASTEPLSTLLLSSLVLAKSISNNEFAKWLKLEISGYYDTNPSFENDVVVPEYRMIPGFYQDENGNKIDFGFLNYYPIREGVTDLENQVEKKSWMSVMSPITSQELAESLPFKIEKFVFNSDSVIPVLNEIRIKLIEKLFEVELIVKSSRKNSSNESKNNSDDEKIDSAKIQIEKLVIEGKLQQALDALLSQSPEKRYEIILHKAKLNHLEKLERMGVLNHQEQNIERIKLISAILQIIEKS